MLLYLIRHTPVVLPDGICYGSTDVDLAEDWPKRLVHIVHKLPREAISDDNLYTSPLKRCHTLAQRLGHNAQSSELLREMDFGNWEGRLWSDISRGEIDEWRNNLEDFRAPGGESLGDVSQRCVRFLEQIEARQHEKAFVMTHGGVVRCLVAHALGLPLKNAARIHVDFGGVSILRLEGELLRLECLNV